MLHIGELVIAPVPLSELALSDRLIALAQEAERAGFRHIAEGLVHLACDVFDEAETRH
ncbi:MAG TPA: hypothetical protein VFA03_01300 [Acetobacteraceae bacterium]|nr:hypothetical protein [Acetobacteraceae bacterium]